MLGSMGYACDCVASGADVLAVVSSGLCDLVLMDCHMPGMDGYEATERIRDWERQHKPERRIPIVAATAHSTMDSRERCIAAGMDDYLSKPFELEELAAVLGKWLRDTQEDLAPGNGRSSEPIDRAVDLQAAVIERCSGDRTLAAKLLHDFIDQTAEDIATISAALAARDPRAMVEGAHRLKGAAGNLALHAAEAAAAELVKLGRAGRTDGGSRFVEALHVEVERAAALPVCAEAEASTE